MAHVPSPSCTDRWVIDVKWTKREMDAAKTNFVVQIRFVCVFVFCDLETQCVV